MNDEKLIASFHEMWDAFPGMARLIDRRHTILAANAAAQARGFVPGGRCADVGAPEVHRGCLLEKTLRTGEGHYDRPGEGLLRGWLPVAGRDDVVVHFSLTIPAVGEDR